MKTNTRTLHCIVKVIGVMIALILPAKLYAQETEELLKRYFAEVRTGGHPTIPKQLSIAKSAKEVLAALSSYQQDTMAVVRSKAYTITQLAGKNARESGLRQEAVYRLVQGCKDKDTGNAGLALDYLTVFRKDDFTRAAKDSIRSIFIHRSAHFAALVRLTGFLEMTDLKENIRPYTKAGNAQSIRWSAIVSLVRMNDAEATTEMMRRIRKLPVNDDVVYELFPDLVYTRHPEAIAYMIEALHSDERNCFTADAEREVAIPCGYRIMEQLAPIIEKYPVALDESGDVKTKDYVSALKTVREWFAKNKNYTIRRDQY